MNAVTYLTALGIACRCPVTATVGRLTVSGEFTLDGLRGIIVRGRRGAVSCRRLNALVSDRAGFVVVDEPERPVIYGLNAADRSLEPLRALPVQIPDQFPTPDVLSVVRQLIRSATDVGGDASVLASALFAAKIDDEKNSTGIFGPQLVQRDKNGPASKLLVTCNMADVSRGDFRADSLLNAAAIVAGFRLTPQSISETGLLLDCLLQVHGAGPSAGLPSNLSFAFVGDWIVNSQLITVSHSLGAQFLPLRDATAGTAFIPRSLLSSKGILLRLFPKAVVADGDFLDWSPASPPNRIILVPPVGLRITDSAILASSGYTNRGGKRLGSANAELLYIEHALRMAADDALLLIVVADGVLASVGHAAFREWLLQRARLIAVISLPAGCCFAGTSIRFSLLYIRKTSRNTAEYQILMSELDEGDVSDDQVRQDLRNAINSALNEGMLNCA